MLSDIIKQQLYDLTRQFGWEKGLSIICDTASHEESMELSSLLNDKLYNCNYLFGVKSEKVLILENKLGSSVCSFAKSFSNTVSINPDFKINCILKKRYGSSASAVCCSNKMDFPFADYTFDIVFIADLLMIFKSSQYNSENILKLLKEVERVLSDDGMVCINYPNKIRDHCYIDSFFKRKKFKYIKNFFIGPTKIEQNEFVESSKNLKLVNNELNTKRKLSYFIKRKVLYPVRAKRRSILVSKGINDTIISDILNSIKKQNSNTEYELNKIMYLNSNLLFLRELSGKRDDLIVRIPYLYNEDSIFRCEKNYDNLKFINGSFFSRNVLTPLAASKGSIKGVPFYTETWIKGRGVDYESRNYDELIEKSVKFSVDTYSKTRKPVSKEQEEYFKFFDDISVFFNSISAVKGDKGILNFVDTISDYFFKYNKMVCASHGDYNLENLLFDRANSICGVIDLDLFKMNGFPLIDVIHLMASRRFLFEGMSHDDFIDEVLIHHKMAVFEREMITFYAEENNIDVEAIPILFLIYWLHRAIFTVGLHPKLKYSYYIEKSVKYLCQVSLPVYIERTIKNLFN